MCLHVQFPEGVCTSGLGIPTYEGVSGEESTWDDERLTREYDLLRSFGDSQGSLLGKSSSFSFSKLSYHDRYNVKDKKNPRI